MDCNTFNAYLENEIYDVETVDVLTTGKIPDDCDTLVVTMPSQDFDEIATNAIIDYINAGKKYFMVPSSNSTKHRNAKCK